MELSLRWAQRSQDEFARRENPNALFGIVQGGMFEHLRDESLDGLEEIGFHGYAIGGLASASRRTRCSASSTTRRPGCRRTSRAT